MPEPFVGEIRIFGFNFPPRGWAFCDGQLLPISQNTALFALLGATYGGNGQTNFALPDLRGRVPLHVSDSIQLGESGGEQTHTLTTAEMPTHSHLPAADTNAATQQSPMNNLWAASRTKPYAALSDGQLKPDAVDPAGGSQPHENMQLSLSLNYCIALQGIFPPRP